MYVLRGAYASNIEWLVPDGPLPEGVEFSDVPAVDLADDRLIRAYRQFRYLVKGGPDMKQAKRSTEETPTRRPVRGVQIDNISEDSRGHIDFSFIFIILLDTF